MCAHHLTRLWQHYTLKLNERATHHLAAMLRSMRLFDPEAYAEVSFFFSLSACLVLTLCQQVPEYFKRGLNCIVLTPATCSWRRRPKTGFTLDWRKLRQRECLSPPIQTFQMAGNRRSFAQFFCDIFHGLLWHFCIRKRLEESRLHAACPRSKCRLWWPLEREGALDEIEYQGKNTSQITHHKSHITNHTSQITNHKSALHNDASQI